MESQSPFKGEIPISGKLEIVGNVRTVTTTELTSVRFVQNTESAAAEKVSPVATANVPSAPSEPSVKTDPQPSAVQDKTVRTSSEKSGDADLAGKTTLFQSESVSTKKPSRFDLGSWFSRARTSWYLMAVIQVLVIAALISLILLFLSMAYEKSVPAGDSSSVRPALTLSEPVGKFPIVRIESEQLREIANDVKVIGLNAVSEIQRGADALEKASAEISRSADTMEDIVEALPETPVIPEQLTLEARIRVDTPQRKRCSCSHITDSKEREICEVFRDLCD